MMFDKLSVPGHPQEKCPVGKYSHWWEMPWLTNNGVLCLGLVGPYVCGSNFQMEEHWLTEGAKVVKSRMDKFHGIPLSRRCNISFLSPDQLDSPGDQHEPMQTAGLKLFNYVNLHGSFYPYWHYNVPNTALS